MAYRPHIRMTAIGTIGTGGGVEQFQYGLNIVRNSDPEVAPLQPNTDVWDDLAEDMRAFHARQESRIWSGCILREVKFARIGADGKYTSDPYIANVADTPGFAGAGLDSFAIPSPQEALAVTLLTNTRGPRGKGRFYIPCPVVEISPSTLLIPVTAAEAIRGSAVTLINALNNQPGFDVLNLEVAIASTFGSAPKVTGVKVGRVVDTIRSRRRQIPEAYTAVAPVA